MDLKDFITQTLTEIVSGTLAAKEKLKQDVAVCCHTNKEYSGYPAVSFESNLKTRQAPLSIVDFKVLVEVRDELSADGSVKAGLLKVVTGSGGGELSHATTRTHEVSFSIPLAWKER